MGAGIVDDGRAGPGFRDPESATPSGPVCGGEVLPVVAFGAVFDHVADLVVQLGGPDLRIWVTELVAGDVGKAAAQASAWEHASGSLAAVRANLAHGAQAIAGSWEGAAAASSSACVAVWVAALDRQSEIFSLVAEYLRDAVQQAIDVAQMVVDVIKEIVAIVAAGLALAHIPIYGQVRAIERVGDVFRLVWDAKRVIAVFWYFLAVMKDAFVGIVDFLTAEPLPTAPALPAHAA